MTAQVFVLVTVGLDFGGLGQRSVERTDVSNVKECVHVSRVFVIVGKPPAVLHASAAGVACADKCNDLIGILTKVWVHIRGKVVFLQ